MFILFEEGNNVQSKPFRRIQVNEEQYYVQTLQKLEKGNLNHDQV